MGTIKLEKCLDQIGGNGPHNIDFIETYYGNTNYLDKVCHTINTNMVFDSERTESQPDVCKSNSTFFMYPSLCNQGWLGTDCENNCTNDNYEGFFCKRKKNRIVSNLFLQFDY